MLAFLLSVFLLVSGPALASTDEPQNVEELIAAVEGTYGDVESLRADFVQVVRSAGGEQKTKGRVVLKRPRLMKWDSTKEPGGTLFVSDGEKMWIYSPTDKQVLVYNDLSQAGGGLAIDLLDSLEDLDEHFDVEFLGKEGGAKKNAFVVRLDPKAEDSPYKEVRLVLSRKKYELQQVILVDQFGTENEFTFSSVKLNPDIPASEFTFEPPDGVETIDVQGI
ncbi:MAG TPA: outer membrane lipoprotein chaperone LolA [Myxococcota bacterium]|nr:outer membrane lipoprotein chaperone LolA [Myxococcota bacterium]